MATIEPLNSVMTYQAQAAEKPQPVTPVNTEVPEDGQTVNVDETTAAVTRPQTENEKESESGGNGSQQQAGSRKAQAQQQSEQLKKAIAEMNKKINNSNEEAVLAFTRTPTEL